MSFDGQSWFEWQKGLKLRLLEGATFSKLWFRSRSAITNTIGFYYGTAEVDDSRLNVIDESALATIYTRQLPDWSITPQLNVNGGNVSVSIEELRDSDNAVLRSIGWSFSAVPATGIFLCDKDGTEIVRVLQNAPFEFFVPSGDGSATYLMTGAAGSTGCIYATYWNN